MISKPLLWFLAIAVLGVLIVTWWAGGYPARVAVINQNPSARDISLAASGRTIDIGRLRGGETKIVRLPSGEPLEVRWTSANGSRVWTSREPLAPGASVVLYLRADDKVDMQGKLSTR